MNKIKIVFLDRETLPENIFLKDIPFDYEIICYPHSSQEEVSCRVIDADIIITNKVKITKDTIYQSKKLRFIAVAATGVDVIDLKACVEKKIPVANIRNYALNTVPEHTFALMLALRRSIIPYHNSVRLGRWQESNQFCYFDYPIKNLSGATLGIIGDGLLGKAVADIAKAFGMQVLFSAYKGTKNMGPLYTPFEDTIRHSDIISIHCPLLESTRNMIDEHEFKQMKPSCLLINTARGGIVNEHALHNALVSKIIAGAAFDVTQKEPPEQNDVMMKLANLPNFILTPHISWASIEAIQCLADKLMDNISFFLAGYPQNIVNP